MTNLAQFTTQPPTMAGELSEKPSIPSSRPSSQDSSDHDSTKKQKAEGQAVSTDPKQDLSKLDSHIVKVVDKEEDIYAHLPEHEREILKRQVDTPDVKSGWKTLYRYSTTNDLLIMAVSSLCAIAAGAALPLMTVRTRSK